MCELSLCVVKFCHISFDKFLPLLSLILCVGSLVNYKINVGMLQKVSYLGNVHFLFSFDWFWSKILSYLITSVVDFFR